MNNKYTRPGIIVNNWLVSKNDLQRLFAFLKRRNNDKNIYFELNTASGNNREYESFEEFENDIDLLRKDREVVSEVEMSCSHEDASGRGHIWIDINFKLKQNKFNIAGNDKDGKKKDWIDGSYEEMQRLYQSFDIKDENIKKVLKERYGDKYHDLVVVEDFDGEKKEEIEGSIKEKKEEIEESIKEKDNRSDKKTTYNKKHDNLKWIIMAIIAILGLAIAYLAWQYPKNPENKNVTGGMEVDNSKIFKGSIFDLAIKLKSEKVKLNRVQMATKNNGLIVRESGYVTDLSLSNKTYYINIAPFATSSDFIICKFNENWGKTLQSIKIPEKINFEGKINTDFDFIVLTDCVIK